MSQASDMTAILAAINAQFTTGRVWAYDLADKAVMSLTEAHILVVVSRRYVPERRASGEVTMPGGRVLARYLAPNALDRPIDTLRTMRAKTTAALEDRILPGEIGPFVFESDDPAEADGGWLVATDTWTY